MKYYNSQQEKLNLQRFKILSIKGNRYNELPQTGD